MKNRNQFTAKLPENYVFEIDGNSSQEAKDVHNAQRTTFTDEVQKRLVEPNFTLDKKFVHINSLSTLNEIEICLKKCNLEIQIPNLSFNASEVQFYVYQDPNSKELKFGDAEQIKSVFKL